VSQRLLSLFFLRNLPLGYNSAYPANTTTAGIQHVRKEIWCQIWWGVHTVCQSNFAYPVFVASFFMAALLEVAEK
jgi:hypothetical protein